MGPRDAVTDLVETVMCWRDSLRDRSAACGVEPEDFAAIQTEVRLFRHMCAALTWAIRKGTAA